MLVKLIEESSGFGYTTDVVNWMVRDEEHVSAIEMLKAGFEVEIPENIAKRIKNLVSVETGEIISKKYDVHISKEEIVRKYKNSRAEIKEKIGKQLGTIKKLSPKLKIQDIDTDENKLTDLTEE